jgi:hypothetical protein
LVSRLNRRIAFSTGVFIAFSHLRSGGQFGINMGSRQHGSLKSPSNPEL